MPWIDQPICTTSSSTRSATLGKLARVTLSRTSILSAQLAPCRAGIAAAEQSALRDPEIEDSRIAAVYRDARGHQDWPLPEDPAASPARLGSRVRPLRRVPR